MAKSIGNELTRRSVMKSGVFAFAGTHSTFVRGLGTFAAGGFTSINPAFASAKPPFGAAVALKPFRAQPEMKKLLIDYADIIVPSNALKWASVRHTKGKFDFSGADEIIDFATQHGKQLHGHALLWYAYNPSWVDSISSPSRLESLLIEHIETVVGRYAGRIESWDVVNEVIAHDPLNEGRWRRGVWYDVLGPRHVEIAFRAAAAADPEARLYLNDYDLEDNSLRTKARQDAVLAIVDRLQKKNIPIHGIGLQAHLYAEREVGAENLQRFVQQIESRGLSVSVSELDVIDWKLTADKKQRDKAVAMVAEEFLKALTEACTPDAITTWGLSDAFSWIDETFQRDDDARARPLPFDDNWQPKPLWDVVRRYTG